MKKQIYLLLILFVLAKANAVAQIDLDPGKAAKTIGKTISDVADVAKNMASDAIGLTGKLVQLTVDGKIGKLPGVFVDDAGKIFYQGWETYLNLQAYGSKPMARELSDDELNWANTMIFNGALQKGKWTIMITNFRKTTEDVIDLKADNGRFFTTQVPVATNLIYVNMGEAYYNPTQYINNYRMPGQVFIHELAHAWQIEKADNFDAETNRAKKETGSSPDLYNPNCKVNSFRSYFKIEQEATMIDRTYAWLYYGYQDSWSCGFNQSWVEANVRIGKLFDNTLVLAANLKKYVLNNNNNLHRLNDITGGFKGFYAVHSNGNRQDGDGYYLPGLNNNSFVYFSNKTKDTTANWGATRDKYAQTNYEFGELGWPETSETLCPDGKGYWESFNHGYIYLNPNNQKAFIIKKGKIFDAFSGQHWEKGALGYPVSDFIDQTPKQQPSQNPGNTGVKQFLQEQTGYQVFEHGVIFWSFTPGLNETTDVQLGNPNEILAKRREYMGTRPASVALGSIDSLKNNNIKNLPPKQISPTAPKQFNNGAINPQPLPPKVQVAPVIIKH